MNLAKAFPFLPYGFHSLQSRRILVLFLALYFTAGLSHQAFAQNAAVDAPRTGEAGPGADADQNPTPVNEFAPDDVRASHQQNYDQGLTVKKVTIEGNHLINEDQIKASMAIRPGSLYNKQNLQRDLKRIYDMGYFTEKIRAVPIATGDGIHLRIEVEENAPVTGVNIEGNSIISNAELQKVFAGQTGLPQNVGQLNESIEKIEKLYADKGYVLARVKSISDEPDGVINLKIDEGRLNKIMFAGNRKTHDTVLKRMMALKPGDVYNEKVLAEDLKRIFSLQAFSDVRRVITASPEDPDKYNLTVEVDEKKTGAISLGGGIDTLTGLFGSVGYADPNFLGRGQSFNSSFTVGTGFIGRDNNTIANVRTYQFEVGWTNPSVNDTLNSLGTNLYGRDLASFNIPLGVERRIGTQLTWSRPLTSFKNFATSLSLGAENVSLKDYATSQDLEQYHLTKSERKDMLKGGSYLPVTPTLAYDTRDNRLDPTSGWLNTLSMTGAYGLGSGSYGTLTANIRRYIKIHDGVTLALNAQSGVGLLGDIPAYNMFRLGGIYSVRGFQEGGIGIGKGYTMGSAELRTKLSFLDKFGKFKNFSLFDNLTAVGFVDAGELYKESSIDNFFNKTGVGTSIGMGLRFNIPAIGPIRIDYAFPLTGGKDYIQRFSFGVGQKF